MKIAYKNKNTNAVEYIGESGSTPSISSNGTWVINGYDTNIRADMGAKIDDTSTSNTTTWSSQKIDDAISEAVETADIYIAGNFYSEDGFGNIRFYNNKWQYYDSSSWVDIFPNSDSYILKVIPQNMVSMTARKDLVNGCILLRWEEPANTVVDGQLVCPVTGMKIYRKKGSAPEYCGDGDLVVDVKAGEFGRYKDRDYVDDSIEFEVDNIYYYHFYPYSGEMVNDSVTNEVAVVYREYELYGFVFDTNESDPFSNISYIEDNKYYRSAYMNYEEDKFDYGYWENAFFVKGCRPCMLNYDGTVEYYLDKNNYALQEDGITASNVSSYDGNVMVEIPLIYYKIVDNSDGTYNIYFSDHQIDDTFKPWWSFYDANGNVIPACYIAAYQGSNISSILRSISGTTNINTQISSTEISYAKKNETVGGVTNIWNISTYSDRQLINMLLMLIGKSTDTQTVFGIGNVYYNSTVTTGNMIQSGTMNNKGLFWGSNSTTTHTGVKVFGIENYWGNQYQRIVGYINDNGMEKVKMTYGQQDGSTIDGYNLTGSGYIQLQEPWTSITNGYMSAVKFGEYGIVPCTTNGSSDSYMCDYYSIGTVTAVACGMTGGYAGGNMTYYCGAFAITASVTTSSDNRWFVGASLSCKPLLTT